MQLNMYIKGVLVDSLPVFPTSDHKVHVDLYTRQLLQKHHQRLQQEDCTPTFSLEGVPSRANQRLAAFAEKFDKFRNGGSVYTPNPKDKE